MKPYWITAAITRRAFLNIELRVKTRPEPWRSSCERKGRFRGGKKTCPT